MVVCGLDLPVAVPVWVPRSLWPSACRLLPVFSFLFSVSASKYQIDFLVNFFLKHPSFRICCDIFFKLLYTLGSTPVILDPGCSLKSPGEFLEHTRAQAHPHKIPVPSSVVGSGLRSLKAARRL